MSIQDVTADNFQSEVLKATGPVLVDFWAPWCGPCKQLAPVLEQLATELEGRLRIVKVNTDNDGTLASMYGVTSVPTLAVFDGGAVVKTVVGARPKGVLLKELEQVL